MANRAEAADAEEQAERDTDKAKAEANLGRASQLVAKASEAHKGGSHDECACGWWV